MNMTQPPDPAQPIDVRLAARVPGLKDAHRHMALRPHDAESRPIASTDQ